MMMTESSFLDLTGKNKKLNSALRLSLWPSFRVIVSLLAIEA
jgi:hypothetical protein